MAGGLIGKLPTKGSFPFEPGKGQRLGDPKSIPRRDGKPVDKYSDQWKWDPIKGEWDVQHPDGSHTNVGLDGEITHGDNNTGRQPKPAPSTSNSMSWLEPTLGGLGILGGFALIASGVGAPAGAALILGGIVALAGD